jgi:HAD superfamily phosphoserine phosphatase-like hydrolase
MTRAQNIGAFFDVDGTLLPAPSLEWRFIGYLLECDQISSTHAARWLAHFARTILRDPHRAIEGNKFYLAGIGESLVNDWENSLGPACAGTDSLSLFDQGLHRIAWHQGQGHRVFLISGTLAPLARCISARVGAPVEVRATELENLPTLRDGHSLLRASARWSGRVAGERMSGRAKSRALKILAAIHDLDLAQSYAYGDSFADLSMLESVAHPVAVNPTRRLARIARRRRWPIFHWKETAAAVTIPRRVQLAAKVSR